MILTFQEKKTIIKDLVMQLNGRLDGNENNIIATCPFCGKKEKFGVYVGKETDRKKLFMGNCFSCGTRFKDLKSLCIGLGCEEILPEDTIELEAELNPNELFLLEDDEDEIDDSLETISLPEGFKRVFFNRYLNTRGFEDDDYDYFPVGVSDHWKWKDYVFFLIKDDNRNVGFVARHTWNKKDIDAYNRKQQRTGGYKIMRYQNSMENNFVKLLYNYDAVIEGETETVILLEGATDVIGITRELSLYDNHRVVPVATFGKKVSDIQIYKLQSKGVRNVVLGYDGDAVEVIKQITDLLEPYFNVYIASPPTAEKDYGDMTFWDFWEVFVDQLMTPREYKLTKIQE